jgi:hypothetical protein
MRPTICFAAAFIVFTLSFCLVSAQNVAGKFAARTKLSDASSSKKKKRSFWVSRKNIAVEDEEDKYGECRWTKQGVRKCWWWDLFLAESEMIVKAVGMSVLCAVVSWLWHLRSQYYVDEDRGKEEDKGEFQPLPLSGVANTVHSLLLFCLFFVSLFAAEDIVCDSPEQVKSLFQSVEVGFEDLHMTLKQKKKGEPDRVILDGSIRGVAKPGRMLAIMVSSFVNPTPAIYNVSLSLAGSSFLTLLL